MDCRDQKHSETRLARSELWAGGIPRLLPEMTYTATGFSNPVRVVFQAIFRPDIVEDTRDTVAVHFRTAILRRREETHLVDRLFFHPVGDAISWFARLLAGMHHGRLTKRLSRLHTCFFRDHSVVVPAVVGIACFEATK
jgi:hypothetical protein